MSLTIPLAEKQSAFKDCGFSLGASLTGDGRNLEVGGEREHCGAYCMEGTLRPSLNPWWRLDERRGACQEDQVPESEN